MERVRSFFDTLQFAADQAETAEVQFREEAAARIKALEGARAFAYRRLNLMKALIEVAGAAENAETAQANIMATLQARLGWIDDSEARAEVRAHFVPVATAIYGMLSTPDAPEDAGASDAATELALFEAWYAETHPVAFWALFETYMPETPLVDF